MSDNIVHLRKPVDPKILEESENIAALLRVEVDDWEPPTNERWHEHDDQILPSIRLAWVTIVHKTSAEVAEIVRNLDDEPLAHLMRQLNWTHGYLKMLSTLCGAAETRLQAHGAPKAVQDWLEDNPLPPEPPQNWRANGAAAGEQQ